MLLLLLNLVILLVRDEFQEEIIYADVDQSIIVIAPPGYGKTYTIARRIEYLVENNKIEGNRQILGLTFSNAAAYEMYGKIDLQDEDIRKNVIIENYHTLCYKFLRNYANIIPRDFSILTEMERIDILYFINERFQ